MNTDEEAVHTEGGKLCCAPAAALGSAGHTKTHFSRMWGEKKSLEPFSRIHAHKRFFYFSCPLQFLWKKKGNEVEGGHFWSYRR